MPPVTDSLAELRSNPPPKSGERRSLIPRIAAWAGVVCVAVAVLGIPASVGRGWSPKRPFLDGPVQLLKKTKPACVFLGDSMLGTRIDQARIDQLAPFHCQVLASPGSSSATWFLELKNYVAVQPHPPKWVFVFFRDRQLTLPKYRADAEYRSRVEEFMHPSEPEVDRVLSDGNREMPSWLRILPAEASRTLLHLRAAGKTWGESLSFLLYPVQHIRESLQEKIQRWAARRIVKSKTGCEVRDAANDAFGPTHLRIDARTNADASAPIDQGKQLDPSGHRFGERVGDSFLPLMLKVANERRIRIVFFRVKRGPSTPAGDFPTDSPELQDYIRQLRDYVQKSGAKFIDDSANREIGAEFYSGDDHIVESKKGASTTLFWRTVSGVLKPEVATN